MVGASSFLLVTSCPDSWNYLAGTKVFVVNPYFEPGLDRYWVPSVTKSALFGTRMADDYFQIHAGGDNGFFYGALKHLIENGWVDREFIAARTFGWQDAEAKARSLSWQDLERSAGQSKAEMYRFAEAFGKARHATVAGLLVDRYGAGLIYGLGFLLWTVATMLTGFATGFGSLLVLRLLLGLGESTANPSWSNIFANGLPENRRGFANSLVDAAGKTGPGVGTFLGGMFLAQWGWRPLFVVLGAASLLWLLPWSKYAPARVVQATARRPAPGLIQVLSKRPAWATSIGLFYFNYGFFFVMTWLPAYLVMQRHYSIREMAVFGSLPFVASALSSMTCGRISDWLIDRGRPAARVRKGFAVSGLFLAALPLVGSALASNITSMVLLIVSFVAIGFFTSNVWAITQRLAGSEAVGRWTGLQNGIANLGSLAAPVFTGLVVHRTGSFFGGFLVASVFMLIACIMYSFVVGPIEPVAWNNAN
jgi:MFS family permease